MTESLIVALIVFVAALFWLGRLFPAHKARILVKLGLRRAPDPAMGLKKGCGGCSGCDGGNCH